MDIGEFIGSLCTSFVQFVKDLPVILLDGLKSFFIPSDNFIDNCIEQIKKQFTITFGLSEFDISVAFGRDTLLSDVNSDYVIGSLNFSGTFVNYKYVIDAITFFRPYIRGFIVFMLVVYSFNQFLYLIGQQGLSLGLSLLLNKDETE